MNTQQFIQYVECHQQAVRRFLTALCCGDTMHADDLAQDTFIKAFLARETFRGDSDTRTWFFRIAYNVFLSSKRSGRTELPLQEAEMHPDPGAADEAFRYQALHAALSRLSEKERGAIVLHYIQGYTVNEIAVITQSSPEAVKQQLSRARKHLKHLLTPS